MSGGHEVRDRADLALSTPVEPLAEAAVGNTVRCDGVHHLYAYREELCFKTEEREWEKRASLS